MFGVSPLLIKVIKKFDSKTKVKLSDILLSNGSDSNYFIVLLLALLSMIPTPFPIPLISIFFGSILIIISAQILFRKSEILYIPQTILNISFKKELVKKIINKFLPKINRLEVYIRIKGKKFNSISKSFLFFIHLCLLISSIIIIIPIPLLSTIPSFAIASICFGLINKNKFFIDTGIVLTIFSIVVLMLFYFFGKLLVVFFTTS